MSEAEIKDTGAQTQLPPASFYFLTVSLRAQAEMQLGLYHLGPEEEKPEPDFGMARHTIDMLAVLQEKTKGNLTMDEQRLLENSLTELRFRYVQLYEEKKRGPAKAEESQTA